MSYCSPKTSLSKKKIDNSCLDEELIDKMVETCNSIKSNKIDTTISYKEKIQYLLKELESEIPCDKEYCLSYSSSLKPIQDQIKNNFRPIVPKQWQKDKKTWLNTLDIMDSLDQYDKAFTDFKFLTVTPIDFDTRIAGGSGKKVCVDPNLCNLSLEKYIKDNVNKLGAVFNLDRHNESGSHWTSMFIDILLGELYYYDSVAQSVPDEIFDLAERVVSQGNDLILANKIDPVTKTHPLIIKNKQLSVSDICKFFLKNDNFILYRFAYLFITETNISVEIIDKELTEKILANVLRLVDITKQEHYAEIPNLDKLAERVRNDNKVDVDKFVKDWVNTNMNIAISNLIDSIKIVGNESSRAKVLDVKLVGDVFHFTLDSDIDVGQDMSFKAFNNFIQHQFRNTECGMYSINFIDNFLIDNKSFIEIINNPINDEKMNSLRYSKYFRPV